MNCDMKSKNLYDFKKLPDYLIRRLNSAGIYTLEDLLVMDYDELITKRNIGQGSITLLREFLTDLGYALKNDGALMIEKQEELKNKDIKLLGDYELAAGICKHLYSNQIYTLADLQNLDRDIFDGLDYESTQKELAKFMRKYDIKFRNKAVNTNDAMAEFIVSEDLYNFKNLPIYLVVRLNRVGIYTLEDLLAIDFDRIRLRNIGQGSITLLREFLADLGYTLKNDDTPMVEERNELESKDIKKLRDYGLSSEICKYLYSNQIYTLEDLQNLDCDIFDGLYYESSQKELTKFMIKFDIKFRNKAVNTNDAMAKFIVAEDLYNFKKLPDNLVRWLNKADIYTLEDLLAMDYGELITKRNIGKGSIALLREFLADLGYTLKDGTLPVEKRNELESKGIKKLRDYGLRAGICKHLYSNQIYTLEDLQNLDRDIFDGLYYYDEQPEMAKFMRKYDIKFRNKAVNTNDAMAEFIVSEDLYNFKKLSIYVVVWLNRAGIYTLGDLLAIDYGELITKRNIGKGSITLLRELVTDLGYTLKNDDTPMVEKTKESENKKLELLSMYEELKELVVENSQLSQSNEQIENLQSDTSQVNSYKKGKKNF